MIILYLRPKEGILSVTVRPCPDWIPLSFYFGGVLSCNIRPQSRRSHILRRT
nr:MAG TPA: hypothetical protein [Caudoviricetes sp.]